MANNESGPWQGNYQEYYSGNGVVITRLLNPGREFSHAESHLRSDGYNRPLVDTIAIDAKYVPGTEVPDWDVKLTDYSFRFANEYVPPNSAAQTRIGVGGYLTTGQLYGCVALGATYRDKKDGIQAFMGHYDEENVRELDDGKLRLSNLFRDFVGKRAVKVTLAYGSTLEEFHGPRQGYDPDDFPIESLIDDLKALPDGSHALLVPYQTPRGDLRKLAGNKFYVGDAGDATVHGWNGHRLEVGERDAPSETYLPRVRAAFAPLAQELWDDDLNYYG